MTLQMLRSFGTIAAAVGITAAAATAVHVPESRAAEPPQAEILHWWSSEGEAKALQVFIDAFTARGGRYYNSSMEDQSATREEAIDRMSKSYPATFTQWNAGKDIEDFRDYGLIESIDDPALIERLRTTAPESVMDAVTYRGEVVAIPLNVHAENWMWSSTSLLDSDPDLLSDDWNPLLAVGGELADKDIPLVAVGDQPWQVRILFTSVLLGISRDVYEELLIEKSVSVVDRQALETAFRVLHRLAGYSRSFGNGNWDEQVAAVAEDEAASVFMGDWAKGAFAGLGKEPGEQYECTLVGVGDPDVLMVIDTLILGKTSDPAEIRGRGLMLDVVSDPDISAAFNQLKGSASPYGKPPEAELDVCARRVYEALETGGSPIPPYTSYGGENGFIHHLDTSVYDFWTKAVAGEEEADALVSALLARIDALLVERADWVRQSANDVSD